MNPPPPTMVGGSQQATSGHSVPGPQYTGVQPALSRPAVHPSVPPPISQPLSSNQGQGI